MASPMLDQIKSQAQVVISLLRAFREELGAERANRIAWKALEGWRVGIVRELASALPEQRSNVDRFRVYNESVLPLIGDAIDIKWLQGQAAFEEGKTPARLEFDITGCRFAQFFRALGEPELGFALLCSMDNTAAEEVGKGDVEFKRTQTTMQGADHCDFRYVLKKQGLA
jgi:hypothetical protein